MRGEVLEHVLDPGEVCIAARRRAVTPAQIAFKLRAEPVGSDQSFLSSSFRKAWGSDMAADERRARYLLVNVCMKKGMKLFTGIKGIKGMSVKLKI